MLFSLGGPSALNDVEPVDWAPTVNLGYQKCRPMSEASRKRTERMKSRDDQHRHAETAEDCWISQNQLRTQSKRTTQRCYVINKVK